MLIAFVTCVIKVNRIGLLITEHNLVVVCLLFVRNKNESSQVTQRIMMLSHSLFTIASNKQKRSVAYTHPKVIVKRDGHGLYSLGHFHRRLHHAEHKLAQGGRTGR